jgi:hypothetical protein
MLEGPAGAAGAFRRRLCRVFRPVFDGAGGGTALDGRGHSGQTALISVVGRCNIIGSLLGENDALNHAAHVPAA